MGRRDSRIDDYLANAPEFAQPILERAREWIHEGCPDCEETLKWGGPFFTYKGLVCGMVAFKAHCGVFFWKGKLLTTSDGKRIDETWGVAGKFTKLSDLPPKREFIGYVKQATALNEGGVKAPKRPAKPKAPIAMPKAFAAALEKHKMAQKAFDALPPSHKREYLEWITAAKTDATRDRRVAQAVEWIGEGKHRNWKYM